MCKIWLANNIFSLLRWSKFFFMIFQGLSVAWNCLRPETARLTILAIKRGLLCNFAKIFKGCHFMGHSSRDFQLLLILNLKNFLRRSFKKHVKHFFKFCFISHFSITRFAILILCNILHLEMKFVLENDSYFIHFLTKASLK